MMPLDQYITASLVLCIVTLILYLWRKNSNLPPGPWGLPFLGYFPFISGKTYEYFDKLSKRHGNVFSFRATGGKLLVVLHGYRTIKDVVVSRAEEFLGRPFENNLVAWVSDGLGISQEEGAPWKEQRKFFLQSAKNFGFGKQEMEERIQDEIKLLVEDLRKTGGKPINLSLHLSYTVSCVISHAMFSKRFKKEDPDFAAMIKGMENFVQLFGERNLITIGWFFEYIVMNFFPACKEATVGKKLIQKIIDKIVDDHIKSFDPEHVKDFVDTYLLHRTKLQKSGELERSSFTIPRLKAITFNMFFEGTESTSAAIIGFLAELCKHEQAQKRAQEELDAVIGRERPPSWSDKPNLPFVDALVLELYRTAMPFTTTTLYSNFEETSICGYRIPKRSIIVASLWSLNNDPEIYKDPSNFNPGRFLGLDGKRIKSEGPFTFGIGKRVCIGESLAQVEVFLIISTIIQNFTLYPGNKEATLIKLTPRD